jgi:phosphoribosyl-ATP pyrophosphohydrolase
MDQHECASNACLGASAMVDSIARLHVAVLAAKDVDPATSRTARLLHAGREKMAKKLAEETMEVIIGDLHGGRRAVIQESADLLYHLVVLWGAAGVHPSEVWDEMDRRERLLGIAEKLPKPRADPDPPQQLLAFDRRRVRKRR